MAMVRDELTGVVYEAREVVTVLGDAGGRLPRTAASFAVMVRSQAVSPLAGVRSQRRCWAPVRGGAWHPVEVLP